MASCYVSWPSLLPQVSKAPKRPVMDAMGETLRLCMTQCSQFLGCWQLWAAMDCHKETTRRRSCRAKLPTECFSSSWNICDSLSKSSRLTISLVASILSLSRVIWTPSRPAVSILRHQDGAPPKRRPNPQDCHRTRDFEAASSIFSELLSYTQALPRALRPSPLFLDPRW